MSLALMNSRKPNFGQLNSLDTIFKGFDFSEKNTFLQANYKKPQSRILFNCLINNLSLLTDIENNYSGLF